MTFKKPQVTINQTYSTKTEKQNGALPTLLIGPRLNVKSDKYLAQYISTENHDYTYPERESLSTIDLNYTKLYLKQAYLEYYKTTTHKWRKIGQYSNRIRTILADNLIFKTDEAGLYPHSSIFKDRGVLVDDKVIVDGLETKVIDFESDKSSSTINPVENGGGNKESQANSIGVPVAGPNIGDCTVVSNVADNYTGSLYDNVLDDSYKVSILSDGDAPIVNLVSKTAGLPTIEYNDIFDSNVSDTYTIQIISAVPQITYQIISNNGDNSGPFVFPAIGVWTNLGSKSLQFRRVDAGAFNPGDSYVIDVTPSTAYIKIETTSGTDQVSSRIFPGWDFATPIGARNLKLTFTKVTTGLKANDYWIVECQKQIAKVASNESGTFIGTQDINYSVKVVQGGIWGQCVVEITSTYTDTHKIITVQGFGLGNAINVGDYGAKLHFDTNVQGGLIKNDIYLLSCEAAKNIGYKTLILENSLPNDSPVIASAAYSGNPATPHNTCTSSGTYDASNPGLELYDKEVYNIIVHTIGAYGTAKIIVYSFSGFDSVLTPITVPVAPGEIINVGNYGLKIAFTGAESFALDNSWRVEVTKSNLDVSLHIPLSTTELPQKRVEDETQNAWNATDEKITINSDIQLKDLTWSNTEPLYISSALIYISYRCLHTIGSNTIITITDESEIATNLGIISPDNPIAWGCKLALMNSGVASINCIYPAGNTSTDWTTTLEKLEIRNYDTVYRLCVLTFDNTIIDAVVTHINKMSSSNKWRDALICRELPEVFDIIGPTGYSAIIVKNQSSSEYDLMKTTNANFSVCKIGDTIQYLGSIYTVKKINTPTELQFEPAAIAGQSVPSNIYIYRIPTVQELAELYAFYGQSYNNKRVISIVPDSYKYAGVVYPGYYLTAIVGGLKSGLVAQQPITNYTIQGVDESTDCLYKFSEGQLDIIANGGNLIVTQDNLNDTPYIRHQVTTSVADLRYRELSIVENYDLICYGILAIAKPFIGKYNIHPGVLAQIETNISAYLFSKTASDSESAGPSILDYKIVKIEQDPNQEDKILINIQVLFPAPLNYIDITIVAQ